MKKGQFLANSGHTDILAFHILLLNLHRKVTVWMEYIGDNWGSIFTTSTSSNSMHYEQTMPPFSCLILEENLSFTTWSPTEVASNLSMAYLCRDYFYCTSASFFGKRLNFSVFLSSLHIDIGAKVALCGGDGAFLLHLPLCG